MPEWYVLQVSLADLTVLPIVAIPLVEENSVLISRIFLGGRSKGAISKRLSQHFVQVKIIQLLVFSSVF